MTGGRSYLRRLTVLAAEGQIAQESRTPACGKERERALVADPPERVSPIALQPMPPEDRRLRRNAGHRLHGIPHHLANASDVDHAGHVPCDASSECNRRISAISRGMSCRACAMKSRSA